LVQEGLDPGNATVSDSQRDSNDTQNVFHADVSLGSTLKKPRPLGVDCRLTSPTDPSLVVVGERTYPGSTVLLHFTPSENVQNIAEHGLRPNQPELETRTAVWLVLPERRALVEGFWLGRVIFEVNDALLEQHLLQVDENQNAYKIYTGVIAPALLRIEGMRRWGPPFEKTPADTWREVREWFRRLSRWKPVD